MATAQKAHAMIAMCAEEPIEACTEGEATKTERERERSIGDGAAAVKREGECTHKERSHHGYAPFSCGWRGFSRGERECGATR